MRKLLTVTVLALLVSLSATAQDFPKAEISGGYQLTRLDGTTLNGWNAALTGNLNHWFGVTGDFSGAYKSESGVDFRNYTYTFGPTIAARGNETFTPFAHALFGGSHASVGFKGLSASDNAFTMIFGGGVDAKFAPHLAFRVAQFDWMSFHANGGSSNNNSRYSAGIVIGLGIEIILYRMRRRRRWAALSFSGRPCRRRS
jgi:hypothetical protein